VTNSFGLNPEYKERRNCLRGGWNSQNVLKKGKFSKV